MFFTYRPSTFFILISFIAACNLVSSDDIPVIFWNVKGNALYIKPVSALGRNENLMSESLKDIHHKDSKVLVFSLNKLSLEDFSANEKPLSHNSTLYDIKTFLESHPHMYLPSIENPLHHIHNNAHCGVQEIVVDNKVDKSVMQSISSAMEKSCVVILHISDTGIISKENDIKSVFLPSFENSNENIVAVFTGNRSSWGLQNNEHHILRNLLQAPSPNDAGDENFINFINRTCIIMYAENATVKISKNGSVTLPIHVTTNGSFCDGVPSNSSILQLNFEPSGNISNFSLRFEFRTKRSAWSTTTYINVTTNYGFEENNIQMGSDSLEAPLGFSYSCGELVLKPKNSTLDVVVTFKRFQIQPYEVKKVFSDSFDCVPYFTIPIWMGIFVSLIYIIITNIGVYALFSVRTMDRFDDPKGKTITVGTTAE